jgi:outer membrane immunogenic protein
MTTKMIRSGLAAALLLIAAPLAVQAADLPPQPYKAPAYVAPEPAYATWSGFYVGVNAGYGFGKSDWTDPAESLSPKGFVAGGTFGYNLQTGTWVWGLEGDIDYSSMKDSDDACAAGTCETKASWLGTARLRVGYAGWNNFLPYITGGAAGAGLKASSNLGSESKMKIGWTAGAGLEYAFMSNWSAKLEYLYADLGSFDCGSCSASGSDSVSFKANLVRGGINYRF